MLGNMNPTWGIAYVGVGWIIRALMIPTVLRRQFTPGASLAWLGIIFLHPYIGLGLYLLVGENRLGKDREKLHQEFLEKYRPLDSKEHLHEHGDESQPDDQWEPVAVQAQKIGRMPVVGGNTVDFITDSPAMIDRLVADIDAAKSTVHLLYYIVCADDVGQRIATALTAAAKRGVACRLLADEYASRAIFGGSGLAAQVKAQGVQVAAALPTSLLRRRDLRNHRKLAIIDGSIAYAGSQNLINPTYGGKRGNPWVDLSGRFTGPILCEFAAIFAEDWAFETGEILEVAPLTPDMRDLPGARMQVVPTGPVTPSESYRRVLLGAIQSASRRLIITTPYFVPDDPTLVSLMMAADRGVEVTLILPETPDQFMSAAAGRAHYARLLDAGVSIHLYRPGLIHTKAATVDDTLALFGSANLDVRSFNLNFELSVLVYDSEVTDRLRKIQMDYLKDSRPLDLPTWSKRPAIKRYADSIVSLLSPLL